MGKVCFCVIKVLVSVGLVFSSLIALAVTEQEALESFQRGDLGKATVEYSRLLKEQPQNLAFRLQLAKTYFLRDKIVKAQEQAEAVLDEDTNDFEATLLLAMIAGKQGDNRLAEDYYLRLIDLNENMPDGYRGLRQLYLEQGDENAAKAIMERYDAIEAGLSA